MADVFSNTSELDLAFVSETTFGTTPTDPTFQRLRVTSESLTAGIQTTTSNEIRPDADISDLIQTGAQAGGDISFEMSYGAEVDTMIAAALRGTFSGTPNELAAGTEKPSFTFEKKFTLDSGAYYQRYEGSRIGSLSLNMSAGSVITGSLNVSALKEVTGTSELTNATYNDANTNDVMAAPDVANITVGNVTGTIYLTDLTLQVNNNLRNQNAIGDLYSVGIGYGLREVTGNMTVYFTSDSKQIYDDFVNGAEASLSFDLTDGSNTYTVTIPRVKYTTGQVTAGGNNQDVLAEMGWQGLYDSAEGTSIKVAN